MKTLFLLLIVPICSFAQVGIGTTNPQAVLHIDGYKNTTVPVTSTNTGDDIVVTTTGRIGIGTTTPAAKVSVINPSLTIPTVRIADGTQGLNKLLISDANGLASWVYANNSQPIVGVFAATSGMVYSYASHDTSNLVYTNTYVDVPNGTWQLNYVFLFQNSGTRNSNDWVEYRTSLVEVSGTTPGAAITPDIFNGNTVNTHVYGNASLYSLGRGTFIIKNQTAGTKRYGIVFLKPIKFSSETAKSIVFSSMFSYNRGENSLSAFRINLD